TSERPESGAHRSGAEPPRTAGAPSSEQSSRPRYPWEERPTAPRRRAWPGEDRPEPVRTESYRTDPAEPESPAPRSDTGRRGAHWAPEETAGHRQDTPQSGRSEPAAPEADAPDAAASRSDVPQPDSRDTGAAREDAEEEYTGSRRLGANPSGQLTVE